MRKATLMYVFGYGALEVSSQSMCSCMETSCLKCINIASLFSPVQFFLRLLWWYDCRCDGVLVPTPNNTTNLKRTTS